MNVTNVPGLTPGDNNTGSLYQILFVPVDDVSYIKPPVQFAYLADCLQTIDDEAALIYKVDFTVDTAEFQADVMEKDGDEFYRIKVSCMVPKDYNHRILNFKNMIRQRFFVITQDHEKKTRLLGYINNQGEKYGLKFSFKFTTNKSRPGYKGYLLEFTLDSIEPPALMYDIADVVIADPVVNEDDFPEPPPES